MNNNEMQELIKNHFNNAGIVDTEALITKLRPTVSYKCEEIKRQQNNIIQTVLFFLGCIAALFIGSLVLFPDYIDYTSEIVEFAGVSLTIGIFCTFIYLIFKALMTKNLNDREIKLKGRII